MAINPGALFPGRTTPADANYPYGGAQNVTAPNDGTGTPWVAALINDVFGFHQALLTAAGIVPSGSPDTVVASQYMDAMNALFSGGGGNEFPGLNPTLVDSVAAIIIGTDDPDTQPHIAIGPNVIQAKTDVTTPAQLDLNRWGGQTVIWQNNDFMKMLLEPGYVHLFGQGGAGINGQNGIFFRGDDFSDSGNNHIGYVGDPTEFKIQNWRGGSIWLNAGAFNGRTEVKPSLRGDPNYTGFTTPMINCESGAEATESSTQHGLQVGLFGGAVKIGQQTICTGSSGFGNELRIQGRPGQVARIGSNMGDQSGMLVVNNDSVYLHHLGEGAAQTKPSAEGGFWVNGLNGLERVLTLTDLAGAGNFLANGTVPMTGKLTINAPNGNIIDANDFMLSSGPGGIGLYYNPGLFGSALEFNSDQRVVLRYSTGTQGQIVINAGVVQLKRTQTEVSADNITAATGGLRANNLLTGTGLERVLTTSDAAIKRFITTTISTAAPSTAFLNVPALTLSLAANERYLIRGSLLFLVEGAACTMQVSMSGGGASVSGTLMTVTPVTNVGIFAQVGGLGGAAGDITMGLNATLTQSVTLDLVVQSGPTAQTFTIDFKQDTASATAVHMLGGSSYVAIKLV